MTASTRSTAAPAALARNRLGVPQVIYFALSGVAPLTVVAGVITTAYAVTGLTSVPAAFYLVAVVLAVFSVGFVAMSRHIRNAGAFYAYIARGLGRPAGVGAAGVALVAYNLLQVGLYGAFGATAASFIGSKTGLHWSWWVWSLIAWAVVGLLGLLRVDLNGAVLAVLTTAELIVIIILTVTGLTKPAGGHYSVATLSPAVLTKGGIGAALAIAVLGYVGFETSAVYTEEARNHQRTVRLATYSCLAIVAVVYTAAGWMLAITYGPAHVVSVARQQGPGMLFGVGSQVLSDIGQSLFLTSLFAAMIAFHSAVGRYLFPLGRDRRGESLWSAVIAPVLSAAALVAMVWLVVDNYATLLGVAPGSALAWIFPAVFAVAAAAGIAWALIMKATRPRAYAAIGSGPGEKQ